VFLAQEKAQVEGFEDEAANDYRHNFGKKGNLITDKLGAVSRSDFPRLINIFAKNVFGIFRARKRSFTDISDYLAQLEETGEVGNEAGALMQSCPNDMTPFFVPLISRHFKGE